jgi:hypothetical protein
MKKTGISIAIAQDDRKKKSLIKQPMREQEMH